MVKLNKEVVQIGDTLYDLSNGQGEVTALTSNSIEVLFTNGRRLKFNEHGQIDGVRRLFWQYPVFLDPPKDIKQWEKTVKAMSSIFKIIESFS